MFPVSFSKGLVANKPVSVRVKNKDYVFWRDNNGRISGIPDVCSHRGAKLSQGYVSDNCIECPYHGWKYNGTGRCVHVPQQREGVPLPQAIHMNALYICEQDGIVWASDKQDAQLPLITKWTNPERFILTDTLFEAPYSYFLQIENLLDPAHIHFVHDGFQGNRKSAGHIAVSKFRKSDGLLSALFSHTTGSVPDIFISFLAPYTVDVSILNKKNQIVRKNIIHACPSTDKACRVLFRDVVVKRHIAPENKILQTGVRLFVDKIAKDFVSEHYQLLNNEIVNSIMEQDIKVLSGQQENVVDYLEHKYVMPTESDKLIIAFRKWVANNYINI